MFMNLACIESACRHTLIVFQCTGTCLCPYSLVRCVYFYVHLRRRVQKRCQVIADSKHRFLYNSTTHASALEKEPNLTRRNYPRGVGRWKNKDWRKTNDKKTKYKFPEHSKKANLTASEIVFVCCVVLSISWLSFCSSMLVSFLDVLFYFVSGFVKDLRCFKHVFGVYSVPRLKTVVCTSVSELFVFSMLSHGG